MLLDSAHTARRHLASLNDVYEYASNLTVFDLNAEYQSAQPRVLVLVIGFVRFIIQPHILIRVTVTFALGPAFHVV